MPFVARNVAGIAAHCAANILKIYLSILHFEERTLQLAVYRDRKMQFVRVPQSTRLQRSCWSSSTQGTRCHTARRPLRVACQAIRQSALSELRQLIRTVETELKIVKPTNVVHEEVQVPAEVPAKVSDDTDKSAPKSVPQASTPRNLVFVTSEVRGSFHISPGERCRCYMPPRRRMHQQFSSGSTSDCLSADMHGAMNSHHGCCRRLPGQIAMNQCCM